MPTLCSGPVQLTEHERMTLDRVLDKLEKLQVRADKQFGRQRQHTRKVLRNELSIFIPTLSNSILPECADDLPKGWCYSLSQGGMGFVTPYRNLPEGVSIGWHLPNNQVKWIKGQIVRSRQVPEEDFWEYGFQFL